MQLRQDDRQEYDRQDDRQRILDEYMIDNATAVGTVNPKLSQIRLQTKQNLFTPSLSDLPIQRTLYNRGLQLYTFFGIPIEIKRRMIDIGKKITFYFDIMTQTIFFLKNINMGIKKRRILI